MSEYQYYEFVALDRPLTPAEMAELRSISTRSEAKEQAEKSGYQIRQTRKRPERKPERGRSP